MELALMFRNVYENPVARKEEDKVIQMLSELYGYYTDHPEVMSREYRNWWNTGEYLRNRQYVIIFRE